MQFVHPELLWALLALSIPIIIHLFHFRRFKKVYFTNVRFLKEIKDEKSTRRRLRKLLVLLCRLLAFAFIILAFAQPFISEDDTAKFGKNNVSVFIDNSFSMTASSEDVPLMDKAKRKAEEIIAAYSETDRFQILSHEMKGYQLRWINKENTIQSIEEIELNPEVSMFENVLQIQQQYLPDDGNNIIYYISDFQKSITDFESPSDSLTEVNLVPLQAVKENNISIDSAWFESVVPALNQNNKLLLRIHNHGSEDQKDLRIRMRHNGQTRPVGMIDIKANSFRTDTVKLLINEAGWQEVELILEDYPIQFDDSYFLAFNVPEQLQVLSINNSDTEKYFQAVFSSLNNFNLTRVNSSNIPYDRMNEFNLIICSDLENISSGLAGALAEYIRNGGNALIFPSKNINNESFSSFFKTLRVPGLGNWIEENLQVYRINTSEFIFENVFTDVTNKLKLPTTKGRYEINSSDRKAGESLLSFRDGSSYISKYPRDKGHLFVCATPVSRDYNDLVLNAEVFVPLLYKAAYASTQGEDMSYTIGRDNIISVNNSSNSDEIIYRITGKSEFIPGQSNQGNRTLLRMNNMIAEAGYYNIILDDALVRKIAMNYDRIESELDYFKLEDLEEKYGSRFNIIDKSLDSDLATLIKEKDKGITFWKWCLILALVFIALEILLLRIWKI